MLFDGFASNKLVGGRPRIEFDSPKLGKDGDFLVSGKLIVEFTQGPFVQISPGEMRKEGPILAIAVPFADAKNEKDAVQQAAERLRQVGTEIEEVAAALLQISQHTQT
jgi:hypothetical protein